MVHGLFGGRDDHWTHSGAYHMKHANEDAGFLPDHLKHIEDENAILRIEMALKNLDRARTLLEEAFASLYTSGSKSEDNT